ncbi:Divalent-cation tolerance protein CutA [Candidatus Methanoperedens nitroreducens]|uniref:Divalent-cation tolerance protein CutA n=2 Tax=Candidatus Methanoperedens nitratireducens TaxID=1392998 RepID=A0A284VR52_9EURY|nr:Divalent-cation tolerance protein CutA [Candidatus Methanoperedens nitroreducens]
MGALMFSIIYITAGNSEEARRIGKKLIEERLAACVNIFPITSIYRWKDDIEESDEFGMIVKTKTEKVKEIEKRVKQLHSYEVPCVLSFDVGEGSAEYLKWIGESVTNPVQM